MIAGIGIDIVEIDRVAAIIKRQPGFVARILSETEQGSLTLVHEGRVAEFVAGRFAAKEAMAKALGTGIGKSLSFHDMEVLNEASGKPTIRLSDEAIARIFPDRTGLRNHLSISHSREYAVAQIIIETEI